MDQTVQTVVNEALMGNPFAWVICLTLMIMAGDKVWWHAKGKKKENGNGHNPHCRDDHREIAEALKDVAEILRDVRSDTRILLDRSDR